MGALLQTAAHYMALVGDDRDPSGHWRGGSSKSATIPSPSREYFSQLLAALPVTPPGDVVSLMLVAGGAGRAQLARWRNLGLRLARGEVALFYARGGDGDDEQRDYPIHSPVIVATSMAILEIRDGMPVRRVCIWDIVDARVQSPGGVALEFRLCGGLFGKMLMGSRDAASYFASFCQQIATRSSSLNVDVYGPGLQRHERRKCLSLKQTSQSRHFKLRARDTVCDLASAIMNTFGHAGNATALHVYRAVQSDSGRVVPGARELPPDRALGDCARPMGCFVLVDASGRERARADVATDIPSHVCNPYTRSRDIAELLCDAGGIYRVFHHGSVRIRENPIVQKRTAQDSTPMSKLYHVPTETHCDTSRVLAHGDFIRCLRTKGDWILHERGWSLLRPRSLGPDPGGTYAYATAVDHIADYIRPVRRSRMWRWLLQRTSIDVDWLRSIDGGDDKKDGKFGDARVVRTWAEWYHLVLGSRAHVESKISLVNWGPTGRSRLFAVATIHAHVAMTLLFPRLPCTRAALAVLAYWGDSFREEINRKNRRVLAFASRGNVESLRRVVNSPIYMGDLSIDYKDLRGNSVLTRAAKGRHVNCVYFLLDLKKKRGFKVPHSLRDNYYIRKALEAKKAARHVRR